MPTSSSDRMISIHLHLPPAMIRELREISERTGTPVSEFIRRALRPAIGRALKQEVSK